MVFIMCFWLALLGVLMRYGLLAAATAFFLHSPIAHGMMTADLGSWYGAQALGAVLLVLSVALYGFFTSFAGKPMLSASAFDDA